ncbi:MAG: penicillin-binding protein activator [Rickettsiales bacterium]|jgi:hypothetical protein|nr:penicillin-binding protein activator [Rickettsiales bacterium]
MSWKIFRNFIMAAAILSGCVQPQEWGSEWNGGGESSEAPVDITQMYGAVPASTTKNVAVLLPLSGSGGELGTGIQHAIEIAFFQQRPENIAVSFHDLSGRMEDKIRVIEDVVAFGPDMIIGPVFADDVALLRDLKPANIPALTFTSAKQQLGGGIFTMALMPGQAVESIVRQIASDGKKRLVILAPDTMQGHMLANASVDSTAIYGVKIEALYLYTEGDAEDMRQLAEKASLTESRKANLVRSKEILSEILIKEKLTAAEKNLLKTQLEDLNKRDSLGEVPFDAVLMLGGAADSANLGAYLRYCDVAAGEVAFYGTALWDAESVFRDSALVGGEYAAMPRISESFVKLYSEIEGSRPSRMNTMGYDAAMLSIKALSGEKPSGAYLLNPAGYVGLDGLMRLLPSGESERALQIMQLEGYRAPIIKKAAASDFSKPLYRATGYDLDRPVRKKLATDGYAPLDYIRLPEKFVSKYKERKLGAIYDDSVEQFAPDAEHVEDATETVRDETFMPAKLSPVKRRLIDQVKMKSKS